MQIVASQIRTLIRSLASAAIVIAICGGVGMLLLTRMGSLALQGYVDDHATLLGPLLLATGVVVVANYLSAARKPQVEKMGIGHDNDLRLDL